MMRTVQQLYALKYTSLAFFLSLRYKDIHNLAVILASSLDTMIARKQHFPIHICGFITLILQRWSLAQVNADNHLLQAIKLKT
jgi:hypothetical protein